MSAVGPAPPSAERSAARAGWPRLRHLYRVASLSVMAASNLRPAWRSRCALRAFPAAITGSDATRYVRRSPTPVAQASLRSAFGGGGDSRRPRFRGLRPRAPVMFDSGDSSRPTRPARVPVMFDSGDSSRPTRPARVPVDEVQGTEDVSLRRPASPSAERSAARAGWPRLRHLYRVASLSVMAASNLRPAWRSRGALRAFPAAITGSDATRYVAAAQRRSLRLRCAPPSATMATPASAVPWTSSTGTRDVRLRRFKPSDTARTGARGRSPRNGGRQPATPRIAERGAKRSASGLAAASPPVSCGITLSDGGIEPAASVAIAVRPPRVPGRHHWK